MPKTSGSKLIKIKRLFLTDMKPELQREFYFSGFLLSHLHFLGKQQRVKFRVRITEENLK